LVVAYHTESPEGAGGSTSTSLRTAIACLQLIAYTNCAINPIIYCLLNERFQLHMRKMAWSLVRLLAVRRRRRRNRQRQIRRNTLSETLHRVHGPVLATDGRPNATRETAMTAGNYVGQCATAPVSCNGVNRPRPDALEMKSSRRLQDAANGTGDDDEDDVSKSTDEVGGPFTPSTEELPVGKLFEEDSDASTNAGSRPAEQTTATRRLMTGNGHMIGIDNAAADC
jgi:hypothetical protein